MLMCLWNHRVMVCIEASGFVTSSTRFTAIQGGWMFLQVCWHQCSVIIVFNYVCLQLYQFLPSSPLTLYSDLKDFCILYFQYFSFFLSKKKGDVKSYNTVCRNGRRDKYLFWYTFNKKHFIRLENNWLENTVHILPTCCMSRKIVLPRMNYCFNLFVCTAWDVSRWHKQHWEWEDISSSEEWIVWDNVP